MNFNETINKLKYENINKKELKSLILELNNIYFNIKNNIFENKEKIKEYLILSSAIFTRYDKVDLEYIKDEYKILVNDAKTLLSRIRFCFSKEELHELNSLIEENLSTIVDNKLNKSNFFKDLFDTYINVDTILCRIFSEHFIQDVNENLKITVSNTNNLNYNFGW